MEVNNNKVPSFEEFKANMIEEKETIEYKHYHLFPLLST